MKFSVKIFLPDGEIIYGSILYSPTGPIIFDSEDKRIDTTGKVIQFSITDSSIRESVNIDSEEKVEFHSLSYFRKMDANSTRQQEYYPRSTKSWVNSFSQKGTRSKINLQKIISKDKYLLSCVDTVTEKIIHFHSINDYEANILKMEPDWAYYTRMFASPEGQDTALEDLLDVPAPTWPELAHLVEGINIPNLKRYETMGETLDQLIPTSFPESVRTKLMIFLSWTINVTVPKEDPLDFIDSIDQGFKSDTLLNSLIIGHIQCLIQGIPPPQYVRILAMAERGALSKGLSPTTEEAELDPWSVTWYRIMEMFPDRKSKIFELTHQLNLSQAIHTEIPVTRGEATRSKEAWLDRFSLIRSNLLMRGYVQENRLGLMKVVYIGGAHRWPHKHLQYAARLGNPRQKPPYIQVMVMPKTAFDRITRTKQNMFPIDWTLSQLNFNLYHSKTDSWQYNASHFLKSFSNQRTMKQLDREFRIPPKSNIFVPQEDDVRLLDLLSWSMYPQVYERGRYDNILQMEKDEIRNKIEFFLKEEILRLQYLPNTYGLVSVCFEIKGPLLKIQSVARASLKHLPSATVMLSTTNEICIIMARVPEADVFSILEELPSKVKGADITMRGYRVSAFAGYVHNLYQRLRRHDGTWDDDVSELLSQMTK